MFGGTVIIEKHHRRVGSNCQLSDQAIVRCRVAHDPAATMEIRDDRKSTYSFGRINDAKPECVTRELDT
jgi:hypothetical protein